MERYNYVNLSINGLCQPIEYNLTQGDNDTHFIKLNFSNNITLDGYDLLVYFKLKDSDTPALVDSYTNLTNPMNIKIPNDILKLNGILEVEFSFKNRLNKSLLTINESLQFKILKTINATYVENFILGNNIKETIDSELEEIMEVVDSIDEVIKEFNDNVDTKTQEFDTHVNNKILEVDTIVNEKIEGAIEVELENLKEELNTVKDNGVKEIQSTSSSEIERISKQSDTEIYEIQAVTPIEIEKITTQTQSSLAEINDSKDTVKNQIVTESKQEISSYISEKESEIKGATYTPNVDSEGNLSWTNDKELENPTTVNIKGKSAIISSVSATIDENIGVPSVEVINGGTELNRIFTFNFKNLKGEKGDNATITNAIATVDSNVGTPSVELVVGGTESQREFSFNFKNLRGRDGERGVDGTTIESVVINVDNNTGVPSGTASIEGTTLTLNLSNLKGSKGDSSIVKNIEFVRSEENGNVYKMVFMDESSFEFTAPKGTAFDSEGKISYPNGTKEWIE